MFDKRVEDFRIPLIVFALLAQTFLLLRLDWHTSPNRTDIGHLAAALRLSETGTFDLFHANPPLLRMLIGYPVRHIFHPQTDWTDYSPNPVLRSEWATGVAFIRANDTQTVRDCFFLGRVLCIPFILLGGYFGYRFARELFGETSGFVFLALWIFSPFILGWGATICPDVPSAAMGIVALYVFRHWLMKQTVQRTLLAGTVFGLLPLLKLTWVIAFGLFPLIGFITAPQRNIRTFSKLFLALLIAVVVVNLGYLFDGTFKPLGKYHFQSKALTSVNHENKFAGTLLEKLPVPFPEQFILGFDTQQIDFENGLPSYLLGQHSPHGWFHYYFVVLAAKETLGTLALTITALILCGFKRYRAEWQNEILILIPMLTLFLLISSQTGFSLHSRYLMPFLPFFYLWISRTGMLLSSRLWVVRTVVPILLLCGIGSSLWCYPHSMSYFNEAVGGAANGHHYLLGSNIDWGQDLYELKDYLDEHTEVRPLFIAVSNIYPLDTLNIHSSGNPPEWRRGQTPPGTWEKQLTVGPRPGWFLVGTNDLYGADGKYEWFQSLTPVKKIGYSLCLYHISFDEANCLREQDGLPKLSAEDFTNPSQR